jgi:UPF0755 protein
LAPPGKLVKSVFAAAFAVAALAAWTAYELQRTLTLDTDFALVRVSAGSSARSVAAALRAAGVPVRSWEFVLAASLTRTARNLRAGRYRIGHETSLLALIDKFRRGDVERVSFTIVEGMRFVDLRQRVGEFVDLRHDTQDWSAERILQAVGGTGAQAEGLFAPDTYTIDPDASDLELYRMAYRAQQERLSQAWAGRSVELPYASPYEVLIMASLIEKETGRPEDRSRIAAVFVNRRRKGMPLQTDPAVIYGLGPDYDGRLHKRDLLRDTPYNTYTRAGLPPTPICLPGRESLEAALHPEPTQALYFVARGDGSSQFSTTLGEHNRAVDLYQRSAARRDTR